LETLVTQLHDPLEIERLEKEREYREDIKVLAGYRLPEKLSGSGKPEIEQWAKTVSERYHSIFLKYPQKKFYVVVETVNGYVFPISYHVEEQFRHNIEKLAFIDERIGLHKKPIRDCNGSFFYAHHADIKSYVFNVEPGKERGGFCYPNTAYVNMYKNVEIFGKESVDMLEILEMMTGGVTSA
jgi:hypothetical protein